MNMAFGDVKPAMVTLPMLCEKAHRHTLPGDTLLGEEGRMPLAYRNHCGMHCGPVTVLDQWSAAT